MVWAIVSLFYDVFMYTVAIRTLKPTDYYEDQSRKWSSLGKATSIFDTGIAFKAAQHFVSELNMDA